MIYGQIVWRTIFNLVCLLGYKHFENYSKIGQTLAFVRKKSIIIFISLPGFQNIPYNLENAAIANTSKRRERETEINNKKKREWEKEKERKDYKCLL